MFQTVCSTVLDKEYAADRRCGSVPMGVAELAMRLAEERPLRLAAMVRHTVSRHAAALASMVGRGLAGTA